MKKRSIFICLTLLWMGLIFFMSAQVATQSSDQSMFITERIIRLFVNKPSPELLFAAEVFVRKTAHFAEYFILAIFVLGSFDTKSKHISSKTLAICILYAMSDEIHQYFVPGRACRAFDVMVDAAGSGLLCLLYGIYSKIKNKKV